MDGYSAKSDRINSTYLKDLVGNLLTSFLLWNIPYTIKMFYESEGQRII